MPMTSQSGTSQPSLRWMKKSSGQEDLLNRHLLASEFIKKEVQKETNMVPLKGGPIGLMNGPAYTRQEFNHSTPRLRKACMM